MSRPQSEVDIKQEQDHTEQECPEDRAKTLGSAKSAFIILGGSNLNNNNNGNREDKTCDLAIKEEPIDEDDDTDAAIQTVQVSAEDIDKSIVIKTEPRVLDDDADELLDVGDEKEDQKSEENTEDEEEDYEFDEDEFDDDDLDFEADTTDSFSTSEGDSRSESKLSVTGSIESFNEEGNNESNTIVIDDMKIETVGNYSKCPRCFKNIKSTFIIRHIKLHDMPPEKFDCPEKNCGLQVNRINNLFRHLREIHKSRKPYLCRKKDCKARFAKPQQLKAHNIVHRAENKKAVESENDNRYYGNAYTEVIR
jgi:hypothetical protein